MPGADFTDDLRAFLRAKSKQANVAPPLTMPEMDILPREAEAPAAELPPAPARVPPPTPTAPPSPIDTGLRDAQGAAAQQRLIAGLTRAGGTIGAGISGRKLDSSAYDAMDASADAPLKAYAAQQMEKEKTAKAASEAELRNPASARSKALQAAVAKTLPGMYSPEELAHLTAADADDVMKFGNMKAALDERRRAAEAAEAGRKDTLGMQERQLKSQAADRALQREISRDNSRLNRETQLEAARISAGAKKDSEGKLPASVVQEIAGFDSASKMMDELMKTRATKTGALSGVAQHLPGTDAAQYVDSQKATAQVVGQILEGGKLSESDFPRYLDLMPTAGDSAERAESKKAYVQKLIGMKKTGQLEALKAAGFKVGDALPGTARAAAAATPGAPGPGSFELGGASLRIYDAKTGQPFDVKTPESRAKAIASGRYRETP